MLLTSRPVEPTFLGKASPMVILRSATLPVSSCTCDADNHPIRFLSSQQVCAKLAIGKRTLWRLVSLGRVPQPIRLSRKLVRWTFADVEAAMKAMDTARQPKAHKAYVAEHGPLTRCDVCNRFLTSFEGVDGEVEWVCVDCDRYAPVIA